MLKKRLIAILPLFNGIVVQSINFNRYLPVGKPEVCIDFLNKWGVDEIVAIDITARRKHSTVNFEQIKRVSEYCFVPLTVGGGINEIEDIDRLLQCGADKISINNNLFSNPDLISKAAKKYGDQCVVASIDVTKNENGYYIYSYLSNLVTNIPLDEALRIAIGSGVGELLINAVHRDGTYKGYDIELFNEVCSKVRVPVLACGGAKNAYCMIDLFNKTNVSAACAGNFFHFSEHSVNTSKRLLIDNKIGIRLETHANYCLNSFDSNGRLLKKSDETLEKLLYLKIEKEII
ncbi:HisA/HisF-related TIM barrel protein [Daejeonella sp.]|uniref:imidazole glycerol phosphate synthase subunit HisF n=1 Tax=Daejeonella sp. TaxID=2805397 RepID=UPI0025B9448D|nr:HisA/HisF-related TIM barrel protein [Daejeonella sp.]